MTTDTCQECGSSINTNALRCPQCAYSPVDSGAVGRKVATFLGVVLTATLVGAPVGIPLIALSWWVGKRKRNAGATGTRGSGA